jgi:GNAT superfamily N-acetyltransferase
MKRADADPPQAHHEPETEPGPAQDVQFATGLEHMDVPWITAELSQKPYWAQGRDDEAMRTILEHSIPFGAFRGGRQVAFARVVSDRVTIAYLADVWVALEERGAGLGRRFIDYVMADPRFAGIRRWLLATKDAHTFYEPLGFTPLHYPERFMEVFEPGE